MNSLENEAARHRIVAQAVEAADRVLMEESDGSVEMLQYLTCELARQFTEKATMAALTDLYRKELNLSVHD